MSTVLTSTANDIIRDALMLIGAVDPGEGPTSDEYTDCRRILNLMVKSWQEKGFLWKISDVTVTLTPGTASYSVGPGGSGTLLRARPLRLTYAVRRVSNIDIPLDIVSRQEYQDLPQKSQQGPAVLAYYDPKLTNGTLSVWYTGTSTDKTIICTFADPLDLFDTGADAPDFPDEWIEALTYNAAVRYAPMFGVSVPKEVAAVATDSYNRMSSFDSETSSIQFMPERR